MDVIGLPGTALLGDLISVPAEWKHENGKIHTQCHRQLSLLALHPTSTNFLRGFTPYWAKVLKLVFWLLGLLGTFFTVITVGPVGPYMMCWYRHFGTGTEETLTVRESEHSRLNVFLLYFTWHSVVCPVLSVGICYCTPHSHHADLVAIMGPLKRRA